MCKDGEHDYFLAHKSTEEVREINPYEYRHWFYFKIGTLVCKNCGSIKQVKLDVHDKFV